MKLISLHREGPVASDVANRFLVSVTLKGEVYISGGGVFVGDYSDAMNLAAWMIACIDPKGDDGASLTSEEIETMFLEKLRKIRST